MLWGTSKVTERGENVWSWLVSRMCSHEGIFVHASHAPLRGDDDEERCLRCRAATFAFSNFSQGETFGEVGCASSARIDANNVPRINFRTKRCHNARHRANQGAGGRRNRYARPAGIRSLHIATPEFVCSVARNPGQALQPSRLWRRASNVVNVHPRAHRLIAETGWRDFGLTWLEVDTQSHARVVVGCLCIPPASLADPREPSEWLRSCDPTEWAWIGPRWSFAGSEIWKLFLLATVLPFYSSQHVPYAHTSTPLVNYCMYIPSYTHP